MSMNFEAALTFIIKSVLNLISNISQLLTLPYFPDWFSPNTLLSMEFGILLCDDPNSIPIDFLLTIGERSGTLA